MGSIPVAGAKRGELQSNSPLLAPVREPISALAQRWVRILRPKIDKLACQAQGESIFAKGEIPVWNNRKGELQSNSPLLAPVREPISAPAQRWVRILRPKIDKLACQAQGESIFAKGEIPLGLTAVCNNIYR